MGVRVTFSDSVIEWEGQANAKATQFAFDLMGASFSSNSNLRLWREKHYRVGELKVIEWRRKQKILHMQFRATTFKKLKKFVSPNEPFDTVDQ